LRVYQELSLVNFGLGLDLICLSSGLSISNCKTSGLYTAVFSF